MAMLSAPAAPMPVPVALKASTTALFISDMTGKIAKSYPDCIASMVPALAGLLKMTRAAGAPVIYSAQAAHASDWLPEIAPRADEPFIASHGQDRFFNTELDKTLRDRGVETMILTGWKISGSVLYTSVGATLRGYTVVVPADASLGPNEFEIAIGVYQMLRQFHSNVSYEALKLRATTLTRSDLVTFI